MGTIEIDSKEPDISFIKNIDDSVLILIGRKDNKEYINVLATKGTQNLDEILSGKYEEEFILIMCEDLCL